MMSILRHPFFCGKVVSEQESLMIKNLLTCLVLSILTLAGNAKAAQNNPGRYISIAEKTDRMRSVFEDLKVINEAFPYFQNKLNDKSNVDPELESAVINAMYDLRLFFSNTDDGDRTFDNTFDAITKKLSEDEVESILRQSGMLKEIVDPIAGGSYTKLEKTPGYREHNNGKDKEWRAFLATTLAFQLEVVRYMQHLMNVYTHAGVTTFISRSDKEITLKPLSHALQRAGDEVEQLKKRLKNLKSD